MKSTGAVTSCQICKSNNLSLILALGHQPIVQNYLDEEALQNPEGTYPLNLVRCKDCSLVQLDYIVDPKLVFPLSYPYRTGLTNMLLRNFEELAGKMKEENLYDAGDLVVDIGSNDGSLLKSFKRRGAKVVGIEPTDAAKTAGKNGIRTYQEFFDMQSARKIRARHGYARIVTATNVFAHIPDAPSLIRAVKALMDKRSVFVSESQYLGDIVEKFEFDTIYHEHLRFYSLKSLMHLANDAGMSVIDAYRITAAGGSIRVTMKRGVHVLSLRGKKLLVEEKKSALNEEKTLRKFAEKSLNAKRELIALLLKIKKSGKTIVTISSPARSNTLLNFTKITPDILEYAGEKAGSPKIGLFTPGMHIPVFDEKKIFEDQPDYALILSWHIGEELRHIYRKLGFKGAFIIPLPNPRIVK